VRRRAERRAPSGARALRIAGLLALLALPARGEPAPEAASGEAPSAASDAAASPAPEPPAPSGPERNQIHRQAAEAFYAADGDRDGVLQALEAMELAPERFESADRNHDGKLTLVEFVDARFVEIDAASAPHAPQEAQPPTRGP
jgi:hypothetical protein